MHRCHPSRRSLARANGCTTIGRRRDFHAGVIACGETQAPRQTVEPFKLLPLPRRFPVDGPRFTITFDGKQLFTATDRTMASAGKAALWTKADSVPRFDGIEIRTVP
jgi:hypothetical protein